METIINQDTILLLMGKLRKLWGRFDEWTKEHPVKFVSSVFAIGFGLAGATICTVEYVKAMPDGVPVKAEADGVVTQEEESTIKDYFLNGKGNEYNSAISGIVNDYNQFLVKGLGWGRNPINDDLHIYISSHEETIDKCDIDSWYGGCYRNENSTMYLQESSPIELFEGIQHEAGHSLRSMPHDNNYLKELPSQANEFYAFFRLYSLNREIGRYYAANNTPTAREHIKSGCKVEEKAIPYLLGAIGFLVQANKAEGDLELAMKNVLNSPESMLEKDTREAVSDYGGNMCDAYFEEYEMLLNKEGFFNSIAENATKEEAEYFISLLSARAQPK